MSVVTSERVRVRVRVRLRVGSVVVCEGMNEAEREGSCIVTEIGEVRWVPLPRFVQGN